MSNLALAANAPVQSRNHEELTWKLVLYSTFLPTGPPNAWAFSPITPNQ